MGTNHNLEFSYEYASSNPEIDQLCDVNSATNPLFVNVGDKNGSPVKVCGLGIDLH